IAHHVSTSASNRSTISGSCAVPVPNTTRVQNRRKDRPAKRNINPPRASSELARRQFGRNARRGELRVRERNLGGSSHEYRRSRNRACGAALFSTAGPLPLLCRKRQ